MSDIMEFTKGSKKIRHIIDTLLYKVRFARDNPNYFYPSGIWIYCGPQGSGKTLSMIQTLRKMIEEYPNAIVCSNLEIRGLSVPVIPFTDYSQLSELSNGVNGVIFVLDEIHVLWNSLESRDIPISEMACFCQMRKDRRVILGTSQVYNRIAKPIREQLQYIVDCHNIGNLIQYNKILDPSECVEQNGHLEATVLGTQVWFHTPELYGSYDTLFKITKAERKQQISSSKRGGKGYGRVGS